MTENHEDNSMTQLTKNLIVAVAQAPVIGVIFLMIKDKIPYSVLMIILGIVYEVLLFLWRILGKEVWETLKPGIVIGLVDWIKVLWDWGKISLLNAFTWFRRRYNRQVVYRNRIFNLSGLGRFSDNAYREIKEIFVDLNIVPSNIKQIRTDPLKRKNITSDKNIWDYLREMRRKEAVALAILGPAGCGKSTLVQFVALTFAENQQHRYKLRSFVPVLLYLREHAQAMVEQNPSLAELAQGHFAKTDRFPNLNPPPRWFQRQMDRGNCLILLDGLDEVEKERRAGVIEWVDRQLLAFPKCHFILTARREGYEHNPLNQARILEVLEFSQTQVKNFIQNWYIAKFLIEGHREDEGTRQLAFEKASELICALKQRDALEKLTANPLLLTMIVNVHSQGNVLPERRVELYGQICDVFLKFWQAAKKIDDPLTLDQKRIALEPLAAAMMEQQQREIEIDEALKIIQPYLQKLNRSPEEIHYFGDNMTRSTNGLIQLTQAGQWGFVHKTFQEYLCAAHWLKNNITTDWTADDWAGYIKQSWWHESLSLFAALTDAEPLIRACLSLNSRPAIELAHDVALEALQLDPALKKLVIERFENSARILLRSTPIVATLDDRFEKFKIGKNDQPLEYLQNDYEDRGETVFDHTTGLLWQKSGSGQLNYAAAKKYVIEQKEKKFAGYDDWRMPTIEELMSLLEPEKKSNDLYIDPIFDEKQRWCWSCDRMDESSSGPAFLVSFTSGGVYWDHLNDKGYVRLVRSGH